jgi:hypothetical protein
MNAESPVRIASSISGNTIDPGAGHRSRRSRVPHAPDSGDGREDRATSLASEAREEKILAVLRRVVAAARCYWIKVISGLCGRAAKISQTFG